MKGRTAERERDNTHWASTIGLQSISPPPACSLKPVIAAQYWHYTSNTHTHSMYLDSEVKKHNSAKKGEWIDTGGETRYKNNRKERLLYGKSFYFSIVQNVPSMGKVYRTWTCGDLTVATRWFRRHRPFSSSLPCSGAVGSKRTELETAKPGD